MKPTELSHLVRQYHPNADTIFTDIINACHTLRFPVSYALALLEKESGFQNLFGSDPVRNPIKGGRVTRFRYLRYKWYRKRGYGMQGVGYTQLTWYSEQDLADSIGGCWRPYPNLVTGFKLLQDEIKKYGKQIGAQRYNGSGPAAIAYGKDFVNKQQIWHNRLVKAGLA